MVDFNYGAKRIREVAGELLCVRDIEGAPSQALVTIDLRAFDWATHYLYAEGVDRALNEPDGLTTLFERLNQTGVIHFKEPQYVWPNLQLIVLKPYNDEFLRTVVLNALRSML